MPVYDPGVQQANPSTATKGERFHVFSSSFLASTGHGPLNYDSGQLSQWYS